MMKIFQFITVAAVMSAMLWCGCNYVFPNTQINDPSSPITVSARQSASGRSVTVPRAEDDPAEKAAVIRNDQAETPVKTIQTPAPRPPQSTADAKTAKDKPQTATDPASAKAPESAALDKQAPPRKPRHMENPENKRKGPPRSPDKYRRGVGMWRAFSRLSENEQQKLLKLQRTEPEKFRAIMHEKADLLYAAEKQRRAELNELAESYHRCTEQEKKAEIKAELRRKLNEDFQQRLQDSRRDIESHKRRTAMMESELQKREKNCTAIVDAMVEHRLAEKTPAGKSDGQK